MPLLKVVLTSGRTLLSKELKIPKQSEGCARSLEAASYTGQVPSKVAELKLDRRELIRGLKPVMPLLEVVLTIP